MRPLIKEYRDLLKSHMPPGDALDSAKAEIYAKADEDYLLLTRLATVRNLIVLASEVKIFNSSPYYDDYIKACQHLYNIQDALEAEMNTPDEDE